MALDNFFGCISLRSRFKAQFPHRQNGASSNRCLLLLVFYHLPLLQGRFIIVFAFLWITSGRRSRISHRGLRVALPAGTASNSACLARVSRARKQPGPISAASLHSPRAPSRPEPTLCLGATAKWARHRAGSAERQRARPCFGRRRSAARAALHWGRGV